MKKLLILGLILIFAGIAFIISINGVKFGSIQLESIKGIKEASVNLDMTLTKATELRNISYFKGLDSLKKAIDKFEIAKKTYESKVPNGADTATLGAVEVETYEVEFLWTIIGNYATEEEVTLTLDIAEGTSKDNYNLNFTVTGGYVGITDFIYDLENDEKLNFKIENLKMETTTVNVITLESTASPTKATTTTSNSIASNTSTTSTTTNTTTSTSTPKTSTKTTSDKTKTVLQAKFTVNNISINLD